MKRIFIGTVCATACSILLTFIFQRRLTLIHFIDMTFYISGGLILLSLVTFVVQRGFFDVVFYSFRRSSQIQNQHTGEEKEDIPKLSELISLPSSFSLIIGLLMMAIMGVSLAFYYMTN